MPDIILKNETSNVIKRVRTPKITIKNPHDGPKSLVFLNTEISYVDGEFLSENFTGVLTIELTQDVFLEDISFTSPIDGTQKTLKVAEVAALIEQFYVNKYLENP